MICGECIHYLHGKLENPCAKNNRYVGYLKEGCHWYDEKGEIKKTKVCSECGRELKVDEFYKSKSAADNLSKRCKECVSKIRRRKKE